MTAKRVWQTTVVATLIGAAVGTVALAAETLSAGQFGSGNLLMASNDERERGAYGDDDYRGSAGGRDDGQWIGIEQVSAAVTTAGFSDIGKIERKGYGYEVYAHDAEGRRWELAVDGRSGQILNRERE